MNASVRDAAAKTFTVCGEQGSLEMVIAPGSGNSVAIAVGSALSAGVGAEHAEMNSVTAKTNGMANRVCFWLYKDFDLLLDFFRVEEQISYAESPPLSAKISISSSSQSRVARTCLRR